MASTVVVSLYDNYFLHDTVSGLVESVHLQKLTLILTEDHH